MDFPNDLRIRRLTCPFNTNATHAIVTLTKTSLARIVGSYNVQNVISFGMKIIAGTAKHISIAEDQIWKDVMNVVGIFAQAVVVVNLPASFRDESHGFFFK